MAKTPNEISLADLTKPSIDDLIKDWIVMNVCIVDPDYGPCKKIVLSRLNATKQRTLDIYEKLVPQDPSSDLRDEVRLIVMEIANASQGDADELGSGIQLYGIFVHFAKNEKYIPRKIFRVTPEM